MDRYVRVEQRKTEQPSIQENEVRIMAAGKMRNYISYATTLLTVPPLCPTPSLCICECASVANGYRQCTLTTSAC